MERSSDEVIIGWRSKKIITLRDDRGQKKKSGEDTPKEIIAKKKKKKVKDFVCILGSCGERVFFNSLRQENSNKVCNPLDF